MRGTIERYLVDAFRGARFTESDYLRHLVRTVAALGERGAAVILGRGSVFILPPERALRVFLVAPREHRLERIAKQEHLARTRPKRVSTRSMPSAASSSCTTSAATPTRPSTTTSC